MSSRKASRDAGATPATTALTRAGVEFSVHAYHHDPASTHFGDEAAQALGVDPHRICKTLIVALSGTRTLLACAVLPVAAQLDLKAFAGAMGAKRASLADQTSAERSTGYLVGAISPLGQRTSLPTLVDASVQDHDTILVSAGRRGLQVELAPADLVAACGATMAPIARIG